MEENENAFLPKPVHIGIRSVEEDQEEKSSDKDSKKLEPRNLSPTKRSGKGIQTLRRLLRNAGFQTLAVSQSRQKKHSVRQIVTFRHERSDQEIVLVVAPSVMLSEVRRDLKNAFDFEHPIEILVRLPPSYVSTEDGVGAITSQNFKGITNQAEWIFTLKEWDRKSYPLWKAEVERWRDDCLQRIESQDRYLTGSKTVSSSRRASITVLHLAVEELLEFSFCHDNVFAVSDRLLATVVNLLGVPLAHGATEAARVLWKLAEYSEVAVKCLDLDAVTHICDMVLSLKRGPLDSMEKITLQFAAIGALCRLVKAVPMPDAKSEAAPRQHLRRSTAVKFSASPENSPERRKRLPRKRSGAGDAEEGEPETRVDDSKICAEVFLIVSARRPGRLEKMDGFAERDEAQTQHMAADALRYLVQSHPRPSNMLASIKGAVQLFVRMLKSSNTNVLLAATAGLACLMRDPDARKNVRREHAQRTFSELCHLCNWCMEMINAIYDDANDSLDDKDLEIEELKDGKDDGNQDDKSHCSVSTGSTHSSLGFYNQDTIPAILESSVIALWGCSTVLCKPPSKHIQVLKKRFFTASMMSKVTTLLSPLSNSNRGTRLSSMDTSRKNSRNFPSSPGSNRGMSPSQKSVDLYPSSPDDDDVKAFDTMIPVEDSWLETILQLTVTRNKYINNAINLAASSIFAILCIQDEVIQRPGLIEHIFALLGGKLSLQVRENAASAFSRVCMGNQSAGWQVFCEHFLKGPGATVMLDICSLTGGLRLGSPLLRELSISVICFMCHAVSINFEVPKELGISLQLLLSSRTSELFSQFAVAALWSLARNPVSRKLFAQIKLMPSIFSVLKWAKTNELKAWCTALVWLCCHKEEKFEMNNKNQLASSPSSITALLWIIKIKDNYSENQSTILGALGALREVVKDDLGAKCRMEERHLGYEFAHSLWRLLTSTQILKPVIFQIAAEIIFLLKDDVCFIKFLNQVGESDFTYEDLLHRNLNREGQQYLQLYSDVALWMSILAKDKRSIDYLGRHNNIRVLASLLKGSRSDWLQSEFELECLELSKNVLYALHNLTCVELNQVSICRYAMRMLLKLVFEGPEDLVELAKSILRIMAHSKSPEVRKMMYKAEITVMSKKLGKENQKRAKESKAASKLTIGAILQPESNKNDPDANFGDWIRAKSPTLPKAEKPNQKSDKPPKSPDQRIWGQHAGEKLPWWSLKQPRPNQAVLNEIQRELKKPPSRKEWSSTKHEDSNNAVKKLNPLPNAKKSATWTAGSSRPVSGARRPMAPVLCASLGGPSFHTVTGLTIEAPGQSPAVYWENRAVTAMSVSEIGKGKTMKRQRATSSPLRAKALGRPQMMRVHTASAGTVTVKRHGGHAAIIGGSRNGRTFPAPKTLSPVGHKNWFSDELEDAKPQENEDSGRTESGDSKSERNGNENPVPESSKKSMSKGGAIDDGFLPLNQDELNSIPIKNWRTNDSFKKSECDRSPSPETVNTTSNSSSKKRLQHRSLLMQKLTEGQSNSFKTGEPEPLDPGPYSSFGEFPDSLEFLGIKIPRPPSPRQSDLSTPVPQLFLAAPPFCPPPRFHTMKGPKETCQRLNHKSGCPGSTCNLMGVLPARTHPIFVKEKGEDERAAEELLRARMADAALACRHSSRTISSSSVEDKPPPKVWFIEKSIFSTRIANCDGRSFFNVKQVVMDAFDVDWQRTSGTRRFPRFFEIHDIRIRSGLSSLQEELSRAQAEMRSNYQLVLTTYQYYVSRSGFIQNQESATLSMTQNTFSRFLQDLAPQQDHQTTQDLLRVFITVNIEEDKNTIENQVNLDNAIMRHEWLEAVLRIAWILHRKNPKSEGSPAKCLQFFFPTLASKLPEQCSVDPDIYRRTRLYNGDVAEVLQRHQNLLDAIYKVYKLNVQSRQNGVSEWKALGGFFKVSMRHNFGISDLDRLFTRARVYSDMLTRNDTKLIFMWSQMVVVDELLCRQRVVSLSFVDFLEVLCRAADARASGSTMTYRGDLAENLETFLRHVFHNLAMFHNGVLRVNCRGSSLDGKVLASLEAYL